MKHAFITRDGDHWTIRFYDHDYIPDASVPPVMEATVSVRRNPWPSIKAFFDDGNSYPNDPRRV